MELITFNLDLVLVLTFIVGTLLPLLVGLITAKVTSPARKAVLLAALSFVTSILSEILTALQEEQPYDVGHGLIKFLAIFVVAVATYFGVWSRPKSNGESVAEIVQSKGVQ